MFRWQSGHSERTGKNSSGPIACKRTATGKSARRVRASRLAKWLKPLFEIGTLAVVANRRLQRGRPDRSLWESFSVFERLEERTVLSTFSIAPGTVTLLEGNGGGSTVYTFTIARSEISTAEAIRCSVTGTGANPASNIDFTGDAFPTNVNVAFPINTLTQEITINVKADAILEANETFLVTLATGAAGQAGTEVVDSSRGTATGTILNDEDVNVSKLNSTQGETHIAINPTNPNNLVIVANGGTSNGTAEFIANTFDGGRTWTIRTLGSGQDGVAPGNSDRFDAAVAFDKFGNMHAIYMARNGSTGDSSMIYAFSADGGSTFNVQTVQAASSSNDKCWIATGPDAQNLANEVVVLTFRNSSGLVARAGSVSGAGVIPSFSSATVFSTNGNYAVPAVGPAGQIAITWQNPGGGESNGNVLFDRDLNGLVGGLSFGTDTTITSTQAGGFDFIPATPDRSAFASPYVAYDHSGGPFNGRLYVAYADESPDESDDFDIFVRRSDNNGTTWSAPVQVNDDPGTRSQFFQNISVDQTTGAVALGWYDARNDSGSGGIDTDGAANTDVQYFGAFSTNGGVSFGTNIRLSDGASNQVRDTTDPGNDFGDYAGIAAHGGIAHAAWVDNSNSTGDNPGGTARFEVYTDQFPIPTSTVNVSASPASVPEDGAENIVYTFTRTGSLASALTVSFNVGGTASSGSDYAATSANTPFTFGATGTVTIAAGKSTAYVTLNPSTEASVEADETAVLTVVSGTGYTAGPTNVGTGTILNDDTGISVAVSPAAVLEDGAPNLIYTFTRSGLTTSALTVNFTVGGAATLTTDYAASSTNAPFTFTATTGTVTFAAGGTTATVTVDPVVDGTLEPNESVILTVVAGAGYGVVIPTVATGTITNDDATDVTVVVSPSSVLEDGASNLVYTFTRTGVTTSALTVNFSVGGTATFSSDYGASSANAPFTFTATTGTVTFAVGAATATVTIDPTADALMGPDETAILTVTAGSGYGIGAPSAASGTILNDDFDLNVAVTNAPEPVVAGSGVGNLVYSAVVTNVSPTAVSNVQVNVSNILPAAGVTFVSATGPGSNNFTGVGTGLWTIGTLGAGASVTLTVTYTVGSSAVHGSEVNLTVNGATATGTLVNTANDADTEPATIIRQVDLAVSQSGPSSVVAGSGPGNAVYIITVHNNGPSDASAIDIFDTLTLPSGVTLDNVVNSSGGVALAVGGIVWNLATLMAGADATLTATFTADSTADNGAFGIQSVASLGNVAEGGNNVSNDVGVVATSVQRQVDLVVSQTESVEPVVAGSGPGNLTYVVTVTNLGPSSATDVRFDENLTLPAGVTLDSITPSLGSFTHPPAAPDGTWNVGSLAPNESATLTIVVTVGASSVPGTNAVSSQGVVNAIEPRINTADDFSFIGTTIARLVDLIVSQTESVDPVVAGSGMGNLTYVVTVTNAGPSNASTILLAQDLTLPPNVTLVSITPGSGASYFPQSPTDGVWTINGLAKGASATLTVVVTAEASADSGIDVISNAVAIVGSGDTRLNLGDDAIATFTSITRQVDLVVTQTESVDPVYMSQVPRSISHTVTLTNNGPSDASHVYVNEVLSLPAGVTLVSVIPAAGTDFTFTTSPSGLWHVAGLPRGGVSTLVVNLLVAPSAANQVVTGGLASITGANETRINLATDSASVSTAVLFADFGDAPASYATLLADNGPRHVAIGPTIGAGRDFESDGQPDLTATGDDLSASDDETGFVGHSLLKAGHAATATVNVQNLVGTAFLSGWIDFNRDGDFADSGEQIATDFPVVASGDQVLNFMTPLIAVAGPSFARFRLSTAAGLSFTGLAPDGEVEDHQVLVHGPGNVTAVPDGNQLVITGDDEFNQISLELGRGGTPFQNTLLLSGRDGTLINGLPGAIGLNGFTGGIVVLLGGGEDVVKVSGGNVTGLISLDGGAGDDRYEFATTKTKLAVNDASGIDTFDFLEASHRVKIDLSKSAGNLQLTGGGNSLKLFAQIENLFGSAHSDILKGNSADNIIVGNAGSDTITGGSGFNLLIGGLGLDKVKAGPQGNSILLAGVTDHDANDDALRAILAEWTHRVGGVLLSIDARVAHLTIPNSGGLNGASVLTSSTVDNDHVAETLTGAGDANLFFQQLGLNADKLKGRRATDRVVS